MSQFHLSVGRAAAGFAVAIAMLLGQRAAAEGLTPKDFENVTTLKQAVEVARDRLKQDGKAEYAPLLSEERVREAVRTAVKSYEALLATDKDGSGASQKEDFEKEIKPACLAVADKGEWPRGCSFFSFYTLTDRRDGKDVAYDGLGLRLRIDTPHMKGFALPVLDLFFGRFAASPVRSGQLPPAAMATMPYTVAADFHVRANAIDAMKQLIADVTRPSLSEPGCQIYHWSQGTEDPTLFLLYMEWQDKASFDAHVATPHVKEAELRLTNDKMLAEPSQEWHFVRL